MSQAILDQIEADQLRKDLPAFRPGDVVCVDVKIVEGANERVQPFEGVVIRKRGHGVAATFTVRKMSFGVGVERTFALHSPRIESLRVVRPGKVRRARLYYLRELSGKAARIQENKSNVAKSPAEAKAEPAVIAS